MLKTTDNHLLHTIANCTSKQIFLRKCKNVLTSTQLSTFLLLNYPFLHQCFLCSCCSFVSLSFNLCLTLPLYCTFTIHLFFFSTHFITAISCKLMFKKTLPTVTPMLCPPPLPWPWARYHTCAQMRRKREEDWQGEQKKRKKKRQQGDPSFIQSSVHKSCSVALLITSL